MKTGHLHCTVYYCTMMWSAIS